MAPTPPGADRLTEAFQLACQEADVKQEELAEQLGVHQTTVSTWLTGKAKPPLRHLPAVDALCGKPKGHVLRLAGYVDDEGVDVLAAVEQDPELDDIDREVMQATYRSLLRRHSRGHTDAELANELRADRLESAARRAARGAGRRQDPQGRSAEQAG